MENFKKFISLKYAAWLGGLLWLVFSSSIYGVQDAFSGSVGERPVSGVSSENYEMSSFWLSEMNSGFFQEWRELVRDMTPPELSGVPSGRT